MVTSIIGASAAVLVALVTILGPILTARSARNRALVEADLLEKLQRISPDEASLVKGVLNHRLEVWEKRTRNDWQANYWRATWPLLGVTFGLCLLRLIIDPSVISDDLTAEERFRNALTVVAASSATLTALVYSLYLFQRFDIGPRTREALSRRKANRERTRQARPGP